MGWIDRWIDGLIDSWMGKRLIDLKIDRSIGIKDFLDHLRGGELVSEGHE